MSERKRVYYGVSIGILMLETYFERFYGDIGNATTWPFPVQYRIVKGAVPNRVTDLINNSDLLQPFKQAADELVAAGVDGITTTCGFLSLYQEELTAHCPVPVATSALLQVPMVERILPRGKRVGILTFSRDQLTGDYLERAGVDPATPVAGLPAASEFQRSIREGDATVPFETLKQEAIDMAAAFVAADPTIGALVCECTNLTPYGRDLKRRLNVPVFDMVSMVHWFHRGLSPQRFDQD